MSPPYQPAWGKWGENGVISNACAYIEDLVREYSVPDGLLCVPIDEVPLHDK
jgi:hypothetical protein